MPYQIFHLRRRKVGDTNIPDFLCIKERLHCLPRIDIVDLVLSTVLANGPMHEVEIEVVQF